MFMLWGSDILHYLHMRNGQILDVVQLEMVMDKITHGSLNLVCLPYGLTKVSEGIYLKV